MSCSTDDAVTTQPSAQNNVTTTGATYRIAGDPKNPANVYDAAGKMHVDILKVYLDRYTTTNVLSTVIGDVEASSGSSTDFTAISSTYSGVSTTALSYVLTNSTTPANIAGATTTTSGYGKQRLNDFIGLIDGFKSMSFESVYAIIVDFENSILADTVLTAADKQLILTTTSVARFSIADTKDNDRNWRNGKIGILGALNGANTNMATAVVTSVSANVAN